MTVQDLKDIFAINAEAARLELERCLKAIDDEPEYPGDMPDEMWEAIKNDRDAMAEALRLTVRLTKAGIRKHITEWDMPTDIVRATISDGFGSAWSKRCPKCGEDTMEVVRSGKVQCGKCG